MECDATWWRYVRVVPSTEQRGNEDNRRPGVFYARSCEPVAFCYPSTRSLMSFSAPDPVVSGGAYRVVSVSNSVPPTLGQFIGEVSFVLLGYGAASSCTW